MDTETIRLVVEVSRLGSFAAAARTHNVDPSSVSRIISQAERELGIRIFQRTTRRLSLTESGERFVERMKDMLEDYDRTREELQGERAQLSGTVRLTTSVAYGHTRLIPLLGRFQETFPELRLELMLSDDKLDLVRERIDFAIRLGPFVEGELVCSRLCSTRYRVCASPGYLATAPALEKPADLADHQSLLFALGDFRSRWLFRSVEGSTIEVPVKGRLVISNALSLRSAAISGLGPVLLADWLIRDDIATGRLVELFPAYEVTATTFETAAWIVYSSRAYMPARVRRTIDFLRSHLSK
jgi:DNA-binding transcriptional LysR family regulator